MARLNVSESGLWPRDGEVGSDVIDEDTLNDDPDEGRD